MTSLVYFDIIPFEKTGVAIFGLELYGMQDLTQDDYDMKVAMLVDKVPPAFRRDLYNLAWGIRGIGLTAALTVFESHVNRLLSTLNRFEIEIKYKY